MTLRELTDLVWHADEEKTDDLAMQCFMTVSGILRTWEQGEASTCEGDVYGVMMVMEKGLFQPTIEGWRRFQQECPYILDLEVPDQVVDSWADAED